MLTLLTGHSLSYSNTPTSGQSKHRLTRSVYVHAFFVSSLFPLLNIGKDSLSMAAQTLHGFPNILLPCINECDGTTFSLFTQFFFFDKKPTTPGT